MGIIGSILFILFFGDFVWWWRADRALRKLPRTGAWRVALGIFSVAQASGMLLVLLDRRFDFGFAVPNAWLTFIYLWHCLFLFPALLLWVPYMVARGIVIGVRKLILRHDERKAREEGWTVATNGDGQVSRRQFLRFAGAVAPAVVTLGTAIFAYWQIKQFRIRRMEVALPQLPPALDGLTIAHVTDLHVGQFTQGEVLDHIVSATNALEADLVLYTGDLINFALSDLDAALAVAGRLQGRHGVFMCEGNHDLFEDAAEFRRRTRAAGLRLLVNEAATVSIRNTPVQFLGLRWGAHDTHPHDPRSRGDAAIEASMQELLTQRDAGAFPILLAHHPHAFDYAKDVSLTLAGHTHGGQLMVTPTFGFGPALYRYWSGLYRHEDRALVVSNGTGNWFPLRTRAPAEIIHLTLRRA